MRRSVLFITLALVFGSVAPSPGQTTATNRLCDPGVENCRDGTDPMGLLELIRAETVGIDVGFWFMEDIRYSRALVKKWCEGVPVRVILDERAFTSYGYTTARAPAENLRYAHDANVGHETKCLTRGPIPMRKKVGTRGIFPWPAKIIVLKWSRLADRSGAQLRAHRELCLPLAQPLQDRDAGH